MNILFTSVGRRGYLLRFFRETKGVGKIVAANSDPLSTGLAAADIAYRTPPIYDRDYIPALLEICKKEAIGMLISLFDADLPVLSLSAKGFEEIGVFPLVSDQRVIGICNDKLSMLEFLKERGLGCVATYTSPKDPVLLKEWKKGGHFLIKPRWGMGSLSLYEVKSPVEAELFYERVREEIASSYLRFESAADRQKQVLIQEKLVGVEYGLDVINDLRGNYCTTVVKRKLAMRSGETDMAKIEENPLLVRLGQCLGTGLCHRGNLDVDVIMTEEGPFVIDMNARFGGGYPFSHMAGVNLVRCLLDWYRGGETDPENLRPRIGEIYAKDLSLVRLSETMCFEATRPETDATKPETEAAKSETDAAKPDDGRALKEYGK